MYVVMNMARQKLTEKERIENRRLRDKLRKRRQRARQEKEAEMQTEFFGVATEQFPILKKPKGTNPDNIKKCPFCGHLEPFCECARKPDDTLKEEDSWLRK